MKIFLACILIFITTFVNGQTITIGTGTASTLYGPIYINSSTSFDKYSWNLAIYNQSEILAAGGYPGLIGMVSWNRLGTGNYPTWDAEFQIYMKHTPLVEFTTAANFDTEAVGAVLVYNNSQMGLPAPGGWSYFYLSHYFNWNGTDNIMILTKWSRASNATGPVFWQATNTTPHTLVSYSYNSNSTMGSLYTSDGRPNIQLNFNPGVYIGDEHLKKEIVIFPNPVNDFFMINEINFESEITITDMTAKIILKSNLLPGKFQKINTLEINSGIYEVTVSNKEYFFREKLVICK